jgi:DNA polymerase III delta prime subunit
MPVEINSSTPSNAQSSSPNGDRLKNGQGIPATGGVDNLAPSTSTHSPIENTSSSPNSSTDPNAITVTIADHDTPIVILYGPPACGKTMTLVRLARYLKDKGYQIVPDKSFRDSQDGGYKKLCDGFDHIISSNEAAESTSIISFMLVKVLTTNGHPLCQILEAPGEHYFNPGIIGATYPPYVQRIMHSNNRKVWAVMLEPNWENDEIRRNYVDNIKKLSKSLGNKGKVLFVYNKVDKANAETTSDTIKEVADLFPGIFEPFKNLNPITRFWKTYNCDLVRFSTGDYSEKIAGGTTYTPSDDAYPEALWKKLMKMIRG